MSLRRSCWFLVVCIVAMLSASAESVAIVAGPDPCNGTCGIYEFDTSTGKHTLKLSLQSYKGIMDMKATAADGIHYILGCDVDTQECSEAGGRRETQKHTDDYHSLPRRTSPPPRHPSHAAKSIWYISSVNIKTGQIKRGSYLDLDLGQPYDMHFHQSAKQLIVFFGNDTNWNINSVDFTTGRSTRLIKSFSQHPDNAYYAPTVINQHTDVMYVDVGTTLPFDEMYAVDLKTGKSTAVWSLYDVLWVLTRTLYDTNGQQMYAVKIDPLFKTHKLARVDFSTKKEQVFGSGVSGEYLFNGKQAISSNSSVWYQYAATSEFYILTIDLKSGDLKSAAMLSKGWEFVLYAFLTEMIS